MALTLTENIIGALAFTLYIEGEEIDSVDKNDPLEYLHGWENIVPGLEKALEGKQVGDQFDITIKPEDAYGLYDDEAIVEVDLEEFDEDSEDPAVGLEVEMMDEEGDLITGTIIELRGDVALVDLNHELAGKTVRYVGEVVNVREPSEEELNWGIPESLLEEIFDEEEFDDEDEDE